MVAGLSSTESLALVVSGRAKQVLWVVSIENAQRGDQEQLGGRWDQCKGVPFIMFNNNTRLKLLLFNLELCRCGFGPPLSL
jgi:hypothetical protein